MKRVPRIIPSIALLLLPALAAAAVPPPPDASPFPDPPSIKGLQVQMIDDALALGIHHAGVNVNVTALVDLEKKPGNPKRVVDGREFSFNGGYLAQLDAQIKPLSEQGVLVYLILIAYPSKNEAVDAVAIHPDANKDQGYTVGAFNSKTPEGRAWLKAVTIELASRWSGAKPDCGRVWGWIVGNEVNSHWLWSNMGLKRLDEAVAEYAQAFRIVHDAVRTASAHARLYISLDHHWAARIAGKNEREAAPGKDYLDAFAKLTADLDWHVAWHPYPEDLFNPRVWADKTVTDDDSSPKVTFKNLEVLCRHLERPELLFQGKPRRLILSEQGFHTPLEPDGETLQAAAYAYAWEKCRRLPLVDAFIYHRHVDHAAEGGLRLGLWSNVPDSVATPRDKKVIRELFRTAGTPAWDAAAAAFLSVTGLESWASLGTTAFAGRKPNIVFVLFDDMGYGEPACYRPGSKLETPRLDGLAAAGMRFTDAHSASAVCTPTRYGLLTGRYPSRIGQYGVLTTFDPPLIPESRLTVASFLKEHGYETACIGKWHLGLKWQDVEERKDRLPIGTRITSGPNQLGFDYFYGFTHARNIETIIEQDGVVEHVAAVDNQPRMIAKAVEWLERRTPGKPFFLYFPMCPPHAPVVPAPQFAGRSGAVDEVKNDPDYGDWVYQGDHMLGQLLDALDRKGLADNTLVIATADNGAAGRPYPPLRGHKTQIHEGGHRVPFVARWPGRIEPGTVSDQTICHNDLIATCAAILGEKLPDDAGEDSVSILPALLGTARAPLREATVHQSASRQLAIRQGPWKLAFSGKQGSALYDLENDLGETRDVAGAHPDIVERLTALMKRYIADGRSTPGAKQPADPTVKWLVVCNREGEAFLPPPAMKADFKKPRRVLPEAAGESTMLFNGRDFDGWVMTDGSPVNDRWEVVDGMIHLKPHDGVRAGSIRTTERFGAFELEFEWRIAARGNSGVKYLAREADSPLGRHFFGCEYQLLDDAGHENGRTPLTAAGALYGLYPPAPAAKQLRPVGEFNQAKIVVADGRVEHWLNGTKIVAAVIGSDDWQVRLKQSKLADIADFARAPGVILLQEHLSEAWFRKLRIKPLPEASAEPDVEPAATQESHSAVESTAATPQTDGLTELVAKTHAESLVLREKLLRATIAKDTAWPPGVWGENLWCLAALSLNERGDEANARLLARAREYIANRPAAAPRTSPEDHGNAPWTFFSITDYVRTLWLFHATSPHYPGRLKPATEAAMKEALWLWVRGESRLDDIGPDDQFRLLGTENHDLNRRPAYYLVLALLEGDPAYRDRALADGSTVTEQARAYTAYFQEWPRSRARTGLWVEVGSNTYQKYSWPALFNLHDLSPDPVIRHRFGLLLDVALIEEEQISVQGRRGGGRSRATSGPGGFEVSTALLYAAPGPAAGSSHSRVIETSRYQPPPEAIFLRYRAFPAKHPFVIRDRVLGELELPGPDGEGQVLAADSALVNYAYRTPHYVLGSTLQNPALSMTDPASGATILKYAGISRQNRWAGMLFDQPASGEVASVGTVAIKGKGGRPQHSFWSVQQENVLVIQAIPQHGRSTLGSYGTVAVGIGFQGKSLAKSERDGWIFAGDGRAFVAVRFLDGIHQWDEAKEVATPAGAEAAAKVARILLHAGDVASHGSLDRFQAAVMANPPVVTPDKVAYRWGAGRQLEMTRYDPKAPELFTLPLVDGVPIDLRPSATYQGPFLNAAFGSNEVTATVGPLRRVLDFSSRGPTPAAP